MLAAAQARNSSKIALGPDDPGFLPPSNLESNDNVQSHHDKTEPNVKPALEANDQELSAEHPDKLTLINKFASVNEEQSRCSEAELLHMRTLKVREDLLGKDHPETLLSISNLAKLYRNQGRYEEAEPLYKRALEASQRVLGEEHPDTLTYGNNLAGLYLDQGRYSEAEQIYERALEVRERVLGGKHPDTLVSINNLAVLYNTQGRYGEAEPLYRRAMEAFELVLGKEHPLTSKSFNNMAELYRGKGRYAEAEPLYKRALEVSERVLGEEHPDTLTYGSNLAALYHDQGRYGEAETLLEQALEARERVLGAEHPDTLRSINNLATLYRDQGRYSEAEPLFKRVLEAREKVLGKDHPDALLSINSVALVYDNQGRIDEAELLYRRALEAQERVLGDDHPETLVTINNLAALCEHQGRFGEAALLGRRALHTTERLFGKEHASTLRCVNNVAHLYHNQGRYSEAEPLYKRALDAGERLLGKEHPYTMSFVGNLAQLYLAQGRDGEAEPLLKRELEASERLFGQELPRTLKCLNNLAFLYKHQGREGEAEPLYKRALEASERVLGKEHPNTLNTVNNLASLYYDQDLFDEAEALFKRVLEAREKVFGMEHPDTLLALNNLAFVYAIQRRYGDAEALHKRVLAASERLLGRDHPNTLSSVSNLAELYWAEGRYGEAEPLHRSALEARERVLGKEHPDTLSSVNNLALLYFTQRDWTRAAQFWNQSTASIAGRTQRRALDVGQAITGKKKSEAEQSQGLFWGLVKAVYRLAPEGQIPDALSSREMFEIAQWALASEAARSVAQMASRGATGNPALALLVRERQDCLAEWQKREGLRNAWLGRAPEKRNAKAEADNQAQLGIIDARVTEIDKQLAAEFPDYAALASAIALPVEEVQAQLRPNEALVLFLDTPNAGPATEETFIWVVTKTDLSWVRSELGTLSLLREVVALRCGLDAASWNREGAGKYAELLRIPPEMMPKDGGFLRFDLTRSHALYKSLFGQVEDVIRGKSLIIVPSGPLTQLPFQVLINRAPVSGDYKSAAWLVRDHAITILPAVSSLKALRRTARPSTAQKPIIGFGNPLLDGDLNSIHSAYYKMQAVLARQKQHCDQITRTDVRTMLGLRRGVSPMVVRGLADIAVLKMQTPLPETADELCIVARNLKANPDDIHLGARATKRAVKSLSASGALAQYRIVHFATHGALAGQFNGTSEPGLILTPPREPTEEDDGYLSASDIAALKLDADWVILSACNTAAGDTASAEALSGLARAFFYAHARALLVSHWAVNSDATVKLITGAVSRLAADKSMGRAEAMRQSMLALIDKGMPEESHPSYWAPFVVVGEGAIS